MGMVAKDVSGLYAAVMNWDSLDLLEREMTIY